MNFTIFNTDTGQILQAGNTIPDYYGMQKAPAGYSILPLLSNPYLEYVDTATFSVCPIPISETPTDIFNWKTKQWEDPRTLQDRQAAQWLKIKQARSQAEYAGFTWSNSTFDSDPVSQNRITGAVTLAQMTANFSIDWILKDNTVRTLNQAEMLEVGLTLGQHVAAQFTKAQALRVLIDSATSPEEVESLVW